MKKNIYLIIQVCVIQYSFMNNINEIEQAVIVPSLRKVLIQSLQIQVV